MCAMRWLVLMILINIWKILAVICPSHLRFTLCSGLNAGVLLPLFWPRARVLHRLISTAAWSAVFAIHYCCLLSLSRLLSTFPFRRVRYMVLWWQMWLWKLSFRPSTVFIKDGALAPILRKIASLGVWLAYVLKNCLYSPISKDVTPHSVGCDVHHVSHGVLQLTKWSIVPFLVLSLVSFPGW